MIAPFRRAHAGQVFLLACVVVGLGTPRALADCALIPTALQILPSTTGGVDRPFASPGDTLRIVSSGACDPLADQFDLDPLNNEISLSFPAATGAADFPVAASPPLTASAVADCGTDRCFAIEFVMPDTTDHSVMAGTGEPLTGPITIHVTNTLAGAEVATVGPLFEPTKACNPQNRFPNLFGEFTLLPPRNSFATGISTMRGTVDGSGALLIPLDYGQVLTSVLGGTANLRLIDVRTDIPHGLASPIPAIPAGENSLIRVPREGDFVRSFSFEGRPIPPLLEVTSSTPGLELSGYGDGILGSVDFIDSVIRIAKTGPDPNAPGNTVQVFALNGEQTSGAGLLEQQNGAGPIALVGLQLGVGPAAPLNSLKNTGQAAAIARDESLEAPLTGGNLNMDGDDDDLVVGILNLDTGEDFSTGLAVLEVAQSPRKAAIVSRGSRVGFLQSEANDAADVNSDGDMLDGIPRLFDIDMTQFSSGINLSADPAARFNGSGPLALGDDWLFFLQSEKDETLSSTQRESIRFDGLDTLAATSDPAISADGLVVAYSSAETRIVDDTPVVWETIVNGFGSVDTSVPPDIGPFVFDVGDAGVAGIDYGLLGVGETQSFTCVQTLTSGLFWTSIAFPTLASPTAFLATAPAPTDPFGCTTTTPSGTFVVNTGSGVIDALSTFTFAGPLTISTATPPFPANLSNARYLIDLDITDPTFVDQSGGAGLGPFQFDFTTDQWYLADGPVSGQQVYAAMNDGTGGLPANDLISKGHRFGEPGDGPSTEPALDGVGNLVAYLSRASNLVDDGGTGIGGEQVFLLDRNADSTVRVSKAAGGGESAGFARTPAISSDGSTVAYISVAPDIAPAAGTLFEVFAYDVASGTNELVSVDRLGGASGSAFFPHIGVSEDGNEIVFASNASDLLPGFDGNGLADIFVRDRAAGTTERISVGIAGAESNGTSLEPDVSGDGNRVVFVSDATNLVPDAGTTPQCYVFDRAKKTTELVSVTLGGEPSVGTCSNPKISGDGRFVAFISNASDLGVNDDADRTYRADLLTGVVAQVSVSPSGAPANSDSTSDPPSISRDGRLVSFASFASNLDPSNPDSNGLSDVYTRGLIDLRAAAGIDLNSDGDSDDSVLVAMEAASFSGPNIQSSNVDVIQVATAAGVGGGVGDLAVFIDSQNDAWAFVPSVGAVDQIGVGVPITTKFVDVAISAEAGCGIDTIGQVITADPATALDPLGTLTFVVGITDANRVQAVDSTPGSPLGKCVFSTDSGDLHVVRLQSTTPVNIGPAADFQVDPLGIAFRTCEDSVGVDLNGDTDVDSGDCEMRFWDFVAEDDGDPLTDPLVRTLRTAIPCDLPGCDPFFEPYRIRGNVLSFVSKEQTEVDSGGSGGRGDSCLPTSPAGACDLTGDNDGDDLAVQIVNVLAAQLAAQVFPISQVNPPQSAPFPEVTADALGIITIELPAEIVPGFESLPPDQLVSVIAADSDGDGTFDNDGVLDTSVSVIDNCGETANPSQVDADGDGLGVECDLTLAGQQANDDPFMSPEPAQVPGRNLCDLNASGIIIQPEVDQIWLDRGVVISAPADTNGDGFLDPTDDRDPDADGQVTAVDHSQCLAMCQGQTGGCPASEPVPGAGSGGGGGSACGLLGAEILPLLALFAARHRRRRSSIGARREGARGC